MSFPVTHKIRVGVLRGGPSSEYEVSLKTGASILKNLPSRYHPQDIYISKAGVWHVDGFEREPGRALQGIDVVFNALHGQYGEDGKVQQLLDGLGVPYTGSGALPSAWAMNKHAAKKVYASHGLRTPHYVLMYRDDDRPENHLHIFRHFSMPVVVKPVSAGSSVGVTIAWDILSIKDGILAALEHSDAVLVEEYVRGREATVGVIDGFRDRKHYSLLPVEIVPKAAKFFDYGSKYGGDTDEICPGNFTKEESAELQDLAVRAHRALGLKHYSRSDFIVSKKGIFILETNTLPGLTEHSLLPKSLHAVGSSLPEFIDHVLTLTIERR